MRKLTTEANRVCRSQELKDVYQNFELSYDIDYLSETLGFPVLDASSFERNMALQVMRINEKEQKACLASFPNVFGQIYVIINESDIDKAHKLGLQLMYI